MKNITICLDESGTFEQATNKIRFIGGFIYEHNEKNKPWDEEKKALEELFRLFCQKRNIDFPTGLHAFENRMHSTVLHENVINHMRETPGYSLVIYMQNGLMPKSDKDTRIICDSLGSNLYEHMLNDFLCNILFHTQKYIGTLNVNLEVARRSMKTTDSKRTQFYKDLGYDFNILNDGSYLWYLTNQQTVKSSISRYMRQNKIDNVNIQTLTVESMKYSNVDDETISKQTGLYAADLCCDYLRECLVSLQIKDAVKHLRKLEPTVLVYVYDHLDELWGELMRAHRGNDYVKLLDCYAEIQSSTDEYRQRCKEILKWLSNMENTELRQTVERVRSNYYFKGEYEKSRLMLEILDNCFNDKYRETSQYATSLYDIADLLMSCWNHKGNRGKAYEYLQKCDILRKSNHIDLDTVILTRIRYISALENDFMFEDALGDIDNLIDIIRRDIENKNERALEFAIFEKTEDLVVQKNPQLGKCLSIKGRLLAFMQKYNESLFCFEEALQQIEDYDNKLITLSYLLHMAISKNDKSLYEKYECEYYNISESKDRDAVLLEEFNGLIMKRKDMRYSIFVYLKALNQFYTEVGMPEERRALIKKIIHTNYEKIGCDVSQHPFESIYKYLSLLAAKIGEEKISDAFVGRLRNFPSNKDTVIDLIKNANLAKLSKQSNLQDARLFTFMYE